jgi:hypothetical protein
MPTVTVGPRVEFDTAGYVRLRHFDGEREHYLYLHRLAAYAAGELDSLDAAEHVHHVDGDRWNNHPENLEALDPATHDSRHGHAIVTDGGTAEHPSPFVTRRPIDASETPDRSGRADRPRCRECGAFLASDQTTEDCEHPAHQPTDGDTDAADVAADASPPPATPRAALAEEGTLYKTAGGACRVVHRDDDCRALKGAKREVVDIEHAPQLPLRVGLCPEPKCWPGVADE